MSKLEQNKRWCAKGQHFTEIVSFGKNIRAKDQLHYNCKKCTSEYKKNRRKNSLEVVQADRDYGNTYYRKNKSYLRVKINERRRNNVKQSLLTNCKKHAKQYNREFNLTIDDFNVLPTHCPVLGLELAYNLGSPKANSYSVDRIDNTKGYVKNNIVVVSLRANQLKKDATKEELRKLYEFYVKN